MKAKNIFSFFTIAIFMLITFSCKNVSDTYSKKANITVQLSSDAERTIMPSYQDSDFTSIVLSGSFNGGETKVLKTWNSYADLQDAEKGKITDLDVGDWNFSIECKIGDNVVFTGTQSKTLAEGDNKLSFELENADGDGTIEATISFECDTSDVKAITAKLVDEDGNDIAKFAEKDVTLSEGKATYTATDVPKGVYIVIFTMYSDEGKTNVLTQASELVSVAAGLVSSGTIAVNSLNQNKTHTITYNLNGAEWASGVTAPNSFTEYDKVVLPAKEHFALGFIFQGWYTSSTFDEKTKITKIEAGETTDVELWGKLEAGYEATADNVADIIAGLQGEGPYTIKLIGEISDETLTTIKTALQKNYAVKVNIDLFETTGLDSIKKDTLSYIYNMIGIVIGNSIIEDYAFVGCYYLENVTIPNSAVTSIGERAFNGCSNLSSAKIGDSVTSIGDYAFSGCQKLETAIIGNSVTSIGNCAFLGCYKLENLTIGNSVTSIGYRVFEKTNISSIIIPDSVISIGESAFCSCQNLETVTLSNAVSSIGDYAFEKCTSLLSIVIPDSISSIARSTFSGCTSLSSIIIPDSISSIGDYAFRNCTSLSNITIPDSVSSIKESAFSGCTSLSSITIPDSVSSIGTGIFSGCTSLSNITIPDSISSIGNYAFNGCSGLASITIGNSVSSIGDYAFQNCTSLKNITIPDSVSSIGKYAFNGCSGLASITIGNSVSSIGDYAFQNCTSLENITIPNSVSSIGKYAFNGCSSLASITIGNSVSSIGDYAFQNCTSLENITIPDSVSSIESYVFYGCSGLVSVAIGKSVSSIRSWAFNSCISLISFSVDPNNPNFSSKDGILFTKDETMIKRYPPAKQDTSFIIPNSVSLIESYAFQNCTNLESITFENTSGWKRGSTSVDVTDTTQNTTYLTITYCRASWTRTDEDPPTP